MDLHAYEQLTRNGACFICALIAQEPGSEHEIIYDDGDHLAFLSPYPTLYGYTLVVPRAHVELVHRDLDRAAYMRLQEVVTTSPKPSNPSCRANVSTCSASAANRATATSTGTWHRYRPARPTSSSNTTL